LTVEESKCSVLFEFLFLVDHFDSTAQNVDFELDVNGRHNLILGFLLVLENLVFVRNLDLVFNVDTGGSIDFEAVGLSIGVQQDVEPQDVEHFGLGGGVSKHFFEPP